MAAHDEQKTRERFVAEENVTTFRQERKRSWVSAVVLLSVLCIGLIVTVIVVAVLKTCKDDQQQQQTQQQQTQQQATCSGTIDEPYEEPDDPPIFHDLTSKEVKGVMDFIYADTSLNLVPPNATGVDKSYMFSVDLYLPDKQEVINYLDSTVKPSKPQRAAVVTLFRGDLATPITEEYKIYPLPNPNAKQLLRHVPFEFRPVTGPEYGRDLYMLYAECETKAKGLLMESFGGSLLNCGDKCLVFRLLSPMGTGAIGEKVRKTWYWMSQFVEFYPLHPVDFLVLVASRGVNAEIEKVWYNQRVFDSVDELVQGYTNGSVPKLRVDFPVASDDLFSVLHQRGPLFPESPQRPPIQIEPDGKRYSVKGQEVQYMNWEFNFRASATFGPQLYNIRYNGERIVYELSLQDVVVFYSDNNPSHMFANFFDSLNMIGQQMNGHVPGVDCPTHGTLVDVSMVKEQSATPVKLNNAFCIFEQSTGEPLRRHHSHSNLHGRFFEGVPNSVLTLRTLITVVNYDYIFDFIFYQNGVIQVKVIATGYIYPTFYTDSSRLKYGFRVHDNIIGNIHHHIFNFKVDMDIKGTSNRYETVNVERDSIPNQFSKLTNAQWDQEKISRNVHRTEKSAAYKFDFDFPKYHVFYNEANKDKYGNQKAYRVLLRGMSKSILPEGSGNEPSGAWMRYQMAVTKRKESERHSSSMYASYDSINTTVNFQAFIDDDDSIEDEDLVSWITLGTHHIPHTEDLPVTHTPGNDLSFFLIPFNYFPEDPAMGSRDSIRIEPKVNPDSPLGVNIERHTKTDDIECTPQKNKYLDTYNDNPGLIFEP